MAQRITEQKLAANVEKAVARKDKAIQAKIAKLEAQKEALLKEVNRNEISQWEKIKADHKFVLDLIKEAGLALSGDAIGAKGTSIYPRNLYHYKNTYGSDSRGKALPDFTNEMFEFRDQDATTYALEAYTSPGMVANSMPEGSTIQSWSQAARDPEEEARLNGAAVDALATVLTANGVTYMRVGDRALLAQI